ncbi:MAG: 4-coumarate--CoA ligase family protein [Gemmatimonadota bacterium]|nr:4-coumarate--CoA ligase family protein [Gemmatimonadota bacterium]MDH3421602.1 4-coumarate--CoA ligase family protein [Gemmatimonadota bacterium]
MIFKSPYPAVDIPDVPVTSYALRREKEFGDKTALIDAPTGETLTFSELASLIRKTAGGLAARGFGKGDVLAIYSPNTLHYPVAFHGAAHAGGVITTVNPMYTTEELAKQLRDSGARFLLTSGPFLENAREAAEEVGGVDEIFTFDGAEGSTPFSELLEADELEKGPDIDPATDLVALPYSSGTTGISKGVMLTHRNLVANMCQITGTASRSWEIDADSTLIAVLPFFHIYGMGVIMNYALSKGANIVIMPRFDLEAFLDAIQRYKVTYAHVVPPILLALAKHPVVDQYDLSSLDVINSGAAPLGEDLARAAEERIGCIVSQGYGLTETSPVTHHARNKKKGGFPQASIGPALPNTEVMIVDTATGVALGVGERGELHIRGPQVMAGYLGQPEATAATIDADGWLHTGDVAYVDEDGNFFIVDRVKELIKYKGYQVAPAELEALLLTNPHIKDAAVIRSPDEEAGEVPKALVVSDGSLSAEDVIDFVAEHVAPHKKIRRVEFVDEVPKSPSGKILRRVLIDRELAAMEQGT